MVAASCHDMFPTLERVGKRGLSSCRSSNAAAMRELLLVVSRIMTPTLSIVPPVCWLASRAVIVPLPTSGKYNKVQMIAGAADVAARTAHDQVAAPKFAPPLTPTVPMSVFSHGLGKPALAENSTES